MGAVALPSQQIFWNLSNGNSKFEKQGRKGATDCENVCFYCFSICETVVEWRCGEGMGLVFGRLLTYFLNNHRKERRKEAIIE